MVGVTGTNGKTTTAFLARHVLEAQGIQTGLLGTVHSVVGGRVEEVERTTPEAVDLQATFRRMLDAGDQACVMEVSSHALELYRAEGIEFDVAVFTNLTQDHLDFHGTLDAYYASKRRLFTPASGPPPGAAVVNADDEWGARLAEEVRDAGSAPVVTFGVDSDADFRATDVDYDAAGATFQCHARGASGRGAAAAAGAVQRLQRAGRDRRRSRARRGAARCRGGAGVGAARARALRARRRRPGLRRAGRLRAHARFARERPVVGARAARSRDG